MPRHLSMRRLSLIVAAATTLSACAQRPENIAAADIGTGVYRNQSCSQLSDLNITYTQRLESLSADQNRAADSDAIGVFLLGIPWSSMSGNDRETDIAVTRGHLNEIQQAQTARRCSTA